MNDIVLVHPVSNAKTIIPVNFENKASGILSRVSRNIPSSEREERTEPVRQFSTGVGAEARKAEKGTSIFQVFVTICFGLAIISFILVTLFKLDPIVRIFSLNP